MENKETKFSTGVVIYAGWDIDEAKEYIKENNLTHDDVRLVRIEDQILVKVK